MAPLPIRVVPTEDGNHEVIDGFKRLDLWRQQGRELIPVIVERRGSTLEHKRLLLLANTPPRTLTAMDEARVVWSLMKDDGLTRKRVEDLLDRKTQWVRSRATIGKRLGDKGQRSLARGDIGLTLAEALCGVSSKDQDLLLGAKERHGLKHQEALALVSSYRVADEVDRRTLLDSPLDVLRPSQSLVISATATGLEHRLERIREALVDLADFVIPPELTPAEQRRLGALRKSVLDQLLHTTRALGLEDSISNQEEDHAQAPEETTSQESGALPGPTGRDRRASRPPLRDQTDRTPSGLVTQDREPGVERGGVPAPWADRETQLARPLPRPDPGQGGEGPHGQPHPARDPRARIPG
jgi:ParB-like chromosome segregation protein Spo0J